MASGQQTRKKSGRTSQSAGRAAGKGGQAKSDFSLASEAALLAILAVCILIFISFFGIGGVVGNAVSTVLFGLFGMPAYLFPILAFIGSAIYISNRDYKIAGVKLAAFFVFLIFLSLFVQLSVSGAGNDTLKEIYQSSAATKRGGGFCGGLLAGILCKGFGLVGAYVIDILILIISLILITERSFLGGVKNGSRKVYEAAREDASYYREQAEQRRELAEERREQAEQRRLERLERREQREQREQGKPVSAGGKETRSNLSNTERTGRRLDHPRGGVALEVTDLSAQTSDSGNGANLSSGKTESPCFTQTAMEKLFPDQQETLKPLPRAEQTEQKEKNRTSRASRTETSAYDSPTEEPVVVEHIHRKPRNAEDSYLTSEEGFQTDNRTAVSNTGDAFDADSALTAETAADRNSAPAVKKEKVYRFPPASLLKKGSGNQGDSKRHLQETAMKLQQTLKNFGVNVTISDVSCGPAVTRYELLPEQGVKVSRIVNLSDDIKLNLAASDIRIEAPIPGKAAVGIEIPNKESVMVRFRDLVESPEFQNHKSNICFTVGKDIGGQTIVTDIAKMPHLLIAGATGSGKSVCINTIIMSILYKANPEDVKLILIDPKVVELSVYNGIPHLFIPVVTDAKKAAGALHWAVSEMTERYQKFAEYQVRDLKGYNAKVEAIKDIEDETKPKKLPQIVIIVDELADLMMVAPGDVEDAICRLAQLARACGIHLIIATQRPSVDVITGLIKANMPSRVAFSVSSGVDSRTILDMNGAEKLLGNGDMLFYPQGYQKPLRVQGPFVSDTEVEAVVDFLKKQSTVVYNTEIEEKMNAQTAQSGGSSAGNDGNERDPYFADAGKFLIEKEKASIGLLQRWFRIGFNRAARIMDQLEDAGVVGPEEGTKPRQILMSEEQFEAYIEEHV